MIRTMYSYHPRVRPAQEVLPGTWNSWCPAQHMQGSGGSARGHCPQDNARIQAEAEDSKKEDGGMGGPGGVTRVGGRKPTGRQLLFALCSVL